MEERQRKLVSKQPARILLLDLSRPFCDIADNVCNALECLFAIACNLSGPTRIPFFSILALSNFAELLLPFSYVRNNFSRIQTAIQDIRSSVNACGGLNVPSFELGLAEACSHYKNQLLPILQNGGLCHQLEIVLFTSQKHQVVQKQVELALTTLDHEHIKRIQIVCMSSFTLQSLDGLFLSNSPPSSTSSEHSVDSSPPTSSLLEILSIETDLLSLQNFFNSWLVDISTDSEHMHIILPPLGQSNIAVTIKCDLHEQILQPAQLPFSNHFTVHPDSVTMKMTFPTTSKAMCMTVPIYRLKVLSLVPITAVCDSLTFGMPMIAQATSCWKMDWDDLDRNQQLFKALCSTLVNKDQALVVQLIMSANPKVKISNYHDIQPRGHFVLIPSDNNTLLMKCLAVQELMLPYSAGNKTDDISQEYLDMISESLDQVEMIKSYNPFNYSSQLIDCLRNSGKKAAPQKQQKRPLEESHTSYTNKMVATKVGQQSKKSIGNFVMQHKDTKELADTLSSKRIKSSISSTAGAKRTLYTESHAMFEPDSPLPIQTTQGRMPIFRARQFENAKPPVSFPTSL